MGSCVSALLASLGGKKNAKRAAYIHFLINIFGSAVIVALLLVFMNQIESAILWTTGSQHLTGDALTHNMAKTVANAHTIFKVFQIAICYPFAKQIVDLTYKLVPGDDTEKEFFLQYIGGTTQISTTAIPQAIHEVERMAEMARENLNVAVEALLEVDLSKKEEIEKREAYVDYLDHAIFDYLNHIQTDSLPESDAKMIGPLFHVISDLERIGDHARGIFDIADTYERKGYSFTEEHKVEIRELLTLVNSEIEYSIDMFAHKSVAHLHDILHLEELIDRKEDKLQKAYIADIKSKATHTREGMLYSDLAASLERVGDHATNIAFSILNENNEDVLRLLEQKHVDLENYLL